MISDELRSQVTTWMAADPDDRDQAELADLLADASPEAADELADQFAGRLQFGTAGLRGAVGAGPNRMNTATVTATTAALARWLLDRDASAAQAGVVIGHDARHRSDEFAVQAARVLAGAGLRVHMLTGRMPTPFLAFAVRKLSAAAGVMITASHNPRADNGYKLYLGDGAQIVPPADDEIEAVIGELGPLAEVAVAAADSPLISRPGDELAQAYLDAICAIAPPPASAAWLRFVYTPLHGVAGAARAASVRAGRTSRARHRRRPDEARSGLPDADLPQSRGAGHARSGAGPGPPVRRGSGDRQRPGRGPAGGRGSRPRPAGRLADADRRPGRRAARRLPARPAVGRAGQPDVRAASRLDDRVGHAAVQDRSGGRRAVRADSHRLQVDCARGRHEGRTARFAFGYEEALGYAVTDIVRDKDGISAALVLLSLAAVARSVGESLLDAYNALEIAHGVHLTAQLTVPCTTAPGGDGAAAGAAPAQLGGAPRGRTTDLTGGTWDLPSADVLQLPAGRRHGS